jgi:hypothetical protein
MAKGGSKILSVPGASDIVSSLLNQKLTLDQIEEKTGFDRNCIDRFKKKYWIREKARGLKQSMLFNPDTDNIRTQWPGQPVPTDLKPNDWLVVIEYAAPVPERPLKIFVPEPETENVEKN